MYPDYKAKTANGTDGHRHCTAQSHVTKLSFNDYLLTWQSIATTKPRENIQNQRKLCSLSMLEQLFRKKWVLFYWKKEDREKKCPITKKTRGKTNCKWFTASG